VIVPSMLEHLPALIHYLDEPTDPLSVCLFLISRLASRHVKVVLGGNGGNELFGGYDRYYGNLYAGCHALLPERLRRDVIGPLLGLVPDGAWYKSLGHQVKWLHQASFLSGGERYARMYGYAYFGPELQAAVAGPELQRAAPEVDAYAPIREAFERAPAEHPVDRMLYADTRFRLPDHSCTNLDRASMAHGLEARSPFMDHKVAMFVARLPAGLKLRWRTMRYAQRKLCARYLPAPLLGREKQAFSSGLPYLLGAQYRHLSGRLLRSAWLARDGILAQCGIDGLLAEQAAGAADHGHRLWLLLHAEAWYRQRICGQPAETLAALIADTSPAASGAA
jgi:asparagine synthase (glutamine-hydrolysing)